MLQSQEVFNIANSQPNMTHGNQSVVEHDEKLDKLNHILAGLFHFRIEKVERRIDIRIILVEIHHRLLILHNKEEQRRSIGENRSSRVFAANRVE